MMYKYKQLSIIAIAIMAATLITATSLPSIADAQTDTTSKSKKPSNEKCNNVKVQIKVNGVEENQTVVASATIGTSAKTKSGTVEVNETSITIPINFKKISPCPPIGSPIFGDVNGTGFTSELKSLKKPNKVTVDL